MGGIRTTKRVSHHPDRKGNEFAATSRQKGTITRTLTPRLSLGGEACCGDALGKETKMSKTLNWCDAQVGSEARLAEQVCIDLPELANEDVSELQKVQDLRRWVSSWWPHSDSPRTSAPDAYWKEDPLDLYKNGRDGHYGGPCGSIAWMLMSIYATFGLDTWIYNFGNPEGGGNACRNSCIGWRQCLGARPPPECRDRRQ